MRTETIVLIVFGIVGIGVLILGVGLTVNTVGFIGDSESATGAVLYDPENPRDAKVNWFMQLWLGPLLATGLGLVFTVVGAGGTLVSFRKGRRKK